MYFHEEYDDFYNLSGSSTFEEFQEKLRIADKVMCKLIECIGTTSLEYMTDRDKNFVLECYNLMSTDLFEF